MSVYRLQDPVLPQLAVDPYAPLTIAAQLTEQIKLLIARGKLLPNQLLPPRVQLAEHLGINHTTIAVVYNDLIASGHLVAHRGKGTFIADSPQVKKMVSRQQFYDLLDRAFRSASQFGISPAEFSAAAYAQATLAQQHKLNLVFANFFPDNIDAAKSLEAEIGLPLVSISGDSLQVKDPQALAEIERADLIVTSIKDMWNVAQVAPPNKEVIGIDLQPDMELLSCISALPRNSKLLFVCRELTSSEAMKQMVDYSINHVESTAVALDWVQRHKKELREFDLVIGSPIVAAEIEYVPQHKLMIFAIKIDPINLLVLQARLAAVCMEKSL